MSQFNVTDLDFDQIKASMIAYFQSDPTYADWDFTGSGLNVLMNILAYNTHYNAMVAYYSLNEAFLDSAQLRGNVVSHAKLLGYIPRSMTTAVSTVTIVVQGSSASPSVIALTTGTRFSTIVSAVKYNFVVLADQTAVRDTSYRYTFTNVLLYEGTLKTQLYTVDNSIPNQLYVIPDVNVDTTTLAVQVKSNVNSSDYTTYTRFQTLVGLNSTSDVYFLQQNSQGTYEIYFGDGIIGSAPLSNNIVSISYVVSDGSIANGANAFVPVDNIAGFTSTSITVTAMTNSSGGAPAETIDSIRYNAPLAFITQDRAVTADDYRAIILQNLGNIQAISVWGGEDAVVPDYGRVYICIKPTYGDTLTQADKDTITGTILAGKNVVSITPVIVDPLYTYVTLDVFFKYNPNLTNQTLIELQSSVLNTISTYNTNNLESFDGVLRYSQLLANIDQTDPSILNSDVRVYMYQKITPSSTDYTLNNFTLAFSSPIYAGSGAESVIESTPFTVGGITCYIGDTSIVGSSLRSVYIYKVVNGVNVVINTIGTLDPELGEIIINSTSSAPFLPDSASPIQLTVTPDSNDLAPSRNQLLEIDLSQVTITGSVDTIAVAGAAGAIGYATPSRSR